MSAAAGASAAAILDGLARRLGVSAAVFVPAADHHAVPIVSGPRQEAAEQLARASLRPTADGRRRNSAPSVADGLLTVPLAGPGGDAAPIGVVVAAKPDGDGWSEQECSLFAFAVQSYAGELAARAGMAAAGSPAEIDEDLAADLRAAVGKGELTLAYQPEIDLPSGDVVAVEALVRWQHPRLGELGPEWFISLAERSDLIGLVGAWVIDTSFAALAEWNQLFPGLELALRVNVSPVQMAGEDMAATVAAALARHGLPGSRICVELTENAPLGDVAQVAQALRRLKELGVTSAIDDLATGYSALSHLRTLPVDFVKIDRSLVTGIDTDRRAQLLVTAVIGLAINFGLGVIAEGVETEGEAATLLGLGCTRVQGHLFGRPMSAAAVVALLGEQHPDTRSRQYGHGL
jgi:EAL domain-containing protein (putative c-di-GMP-specific phosphodiesterase class I)